MILAKIHVTLKKSVLDPQGVAISEALHSMGYPHVESARLGKYLELRLDDRGRSKNELQAQVKDMCERLLANTVIEHYEFELQAIPS